MWLFDACSHLFYSVATVFAPTAGALGTDPLFFLFRRHDHDHLAAFHLGELLNLTVWFKILFQALKHPVPDILMCHLTSTETQGDLAFITIFQELDDVAELDVVVTFIGPWAELDFLDGNHFLLQLGFMGFFLLGIPELAIVHKTADRRTGSRGHLNDIDIRLLSQSECFPQGHDTNLLIVNADKADFLGGNLAVDAIGFLGSYLIPHLLQLSLSADGIISSH